jgi:bifunctional non-homologous end joining protein LigD
MRFPEVRRIGRAIGHREVILDGVIVPIDPADGHLLEDSSGLDRRLRIGSDSGARNASRTAPVVFVAFDILWVEGRPITSLPWELRRRQLDDLRLDGPGWRTNDVLSLDAAFEALDHTVCGIVAKRAAATYAINTTSTDWIRTTCDATVLASGS